MHKVVPLITCIVGKFIIHIYPLIMLPKVILVITCHSLSLYIYILLVLRLPCLFVNLPGPFKYPQTWWFTPESKYFLHFLEVFGGPRYLYHSISIYTYLNLKLYILYINPTDSLVTAYRAHWPGSPPSQALWCCFSC
jgi:hypothetical protein